MATFTKTPQVLLPLTSLTSPDIVLGTPLDVSTYIAGTLGIRLGRRVTTALSAPVNFRVEVSHLSTPGFWFVLMAYASKIGAVSSFAVTGAGTAGQKVLNIGSGTGSVGEYSYIHNGTLANSEFQRIKASAAATSITMEENLVNAQGSSTIYQGAEQFTLQLDLVSCAYLRVVADNLNSGQTVSVESRGQFLSGIS